MSGFRLGELLYIVNNDGWDIFIEKYVPTAEQLRCSKYDKLYRTYNVDIRNKLVM